jgi:hypothetical protein
MDEDTVFLICPRCLMHAYPEGTGKTSRADAGAHICSGCSCDESNIEYAGMPVQPPDAWPVLWQSFTVELVSSLEHQFTEAAVRARDLGLRDA